MQTLQDSFQPFVTDPQPVPPRIFEYDLETKLFLSSRVYSVPAETHQLVFSPDTYGAPFLVSGDVWRLIEQFKDGSTVGHALLGAMPEELDFGELLDVVSLLEVRGILRGDRAPRRYLATRLDQNPAREISVWFHINNHCNLDCSYCFVHKFKSSMDEETFTTFADNLEATVRSRKLTGVTVKFAGGEPTLDLTRMEAYHRELKRRMQALGARYRSAILSNGTAITEKLIAFLQNEGVSISISLDGYGEEGHDTYRVYKNSRKGSWGRIKRNIDLLLSRGIKPYITATISGHSSKTLPDLVDWIFSNNMRTRLGVVREPDETWEDRAGMKAAYKRLTDTLSENFERAFAVLEDGKFRMNPVSDITICELRFQSPSFSAPCGIGSNHIVLQDDGRIASCPMTIREDSARDTDKDLISAMSGTFALDADRRNAREKNCLDCQWFPVCVGGCPVNNERANGDPYTISPLHDFYQYVIPRFLRFCGHKLLQEMHHRSMQGFSLVDLY